MVLLPNLVEENFLVRGDLDSHIASDMVDETSNTYEMIEGPRQLSGYTILLDFEKENS